MNKKLSRLMTVDEFDKGYWYATELQKFANRIGFPGASKLRKDELELAITHHLLVPGIPIRFANFRSSVAYQYPVSNSSTVIDLESCFFMGILVNAVFGPKMGSGPFYHPFY